LRAGKVGVLFRARSEDGAALIENYGAGSAGSNIDAEDWNTTSFLHKTCQRQVRAPFVDGELRQGTSQKDLR
jgi:hypothetical protein